MTTQDQIDNANKRIDALTSEIHADIREMSKSIGRMESQIESQNKMISLKTLRILVIAAVAALGAAGVVKADINVPQPCFVDAGVYDAGVDAN